MSDQQGDNGGDEWKKSLPGLSGSDNPLCTPKQIKNSTLDELRRDERLWTAYERGWCDLLQSYMNMQLMQSETSYMLPELALPGQLQGPAGAAAPGAAGVATAASASDPANASSGGDPANASAAAPVMMGSPDKVTGAPDPVRSPGATGKSAAELVIDNGPAKRIDVRLLTSRIKRTYKYADVRQCEFQGLGPRAVVQQTPPEVGSVDDSEVAEQLSTIRIKITTPEATEFELTDTFDDDEKPNTDDE